MQLSHYSRASAAAFRSHIVRESRAPSSAIPAAGSIVAIDSPYRYDYVAARNRIAHSRNAPAHRRRESVGSPGGQIAKHASARQVFQQCAPTVIIMSVIRMYMQRRRLRGNNVMTVVVPAHAIRCVTSSPGWTQRPSAAHISISSPQPGPIVLCACACV